MKWIYAIAIGGLIAGCEMTDAGDPCEASELSTFFCAGDDVLQCRFVEGERIWTKVDECPGEQVCEADGDGREYSCTNNN